MATVSIYTGQWTDHSYGPVLGAQVTLGSKSSQVLIAFIALFTGLVGTVTWKLLGFLFYWSRVSESPRDGLDHQMNILFRNAASPLEFGISSLQAGIAWKHKTKRALLRGGFFAAIALSLFTVFAVAGIFTSYMASTGAVLIRSSLCGQLVAPNAYTLDPTDGAKLSFASTIENSQNLILSSAYARNCYPSQSLDGTSTVDRSGPASDCDYFVQSRFNATTTINEAPCPFNEGVCASDVVQIDSGMIDSHHDLGINAPASGRIQFRKIQTCSVLASEGFTSDTWTNNSADGDQALWFYGRARYYSQDSKNFTGPAYNATFAYSAASYEARDVPYKLMVAGTTMYSLDGLRLYNTSSTLTTRVNDWLNLFFLANRVNFLEPVTDPWFNATKEGWWINSAGGNATVYTSEYPGSVLGCVTRFQLCNPNMNNLCTPLNGTDGETAENGYWIPPIYDSIGLNDLQVNIAENVSTAFNYGDMNSIVKVMGESSLVAYDHLVDQATLISQGLPSTQWITELQNLFNVGLAYLQRRAVLSAQGHSDPLLVSYTQPWPASDVNNNYLCGNQKIRSSAYSSFSILGLSLVFGMGGLLIIICILIFAVLPLLERRSKKIRALFPGYKRKAWQKDGLLQMQRSLYEKLDLGDWEGHSNNFPTTKKGQLFRAPTIVDTVERRNSSCAETVVDAEHGLSKGEHESSSTLDSESAKSFGQ